MAQRSLIKTILPCLSENIKSPDLSLTLNGGIQKFPDLILFPYFSLTMATLSEILKKTLRGIKLPFCGHGLNFFLLLRDTCTNSKRTCCLPSSFLNTLKSTRKAPTVDLLRLNILRGTVAPRYNEPCYNEDPIITNNI